MDEYHYVVYKTTNNVNGRTYVGVHKTKNIDDAYLGSGTLIRRAVKKYGRENFSKVILAVFDNPDDMFFMEELLVNETTLQENKSYNLVRGGRNSISFVNDNLEQFRPAEKRKQWAAKGRQAINELYTIEERHVWSIRGTNRAKELQVGLYNSANRALGGFAGKQHTEESKRSIGEKNSQLQKGKRNSQFGKIWIYSDKQRKCLSVLKDAANVYLEQGWKRGRKKYM
jgi:hypothetical protein